MHFIEYLQKEKGYKHISGPYMKYSTTTKDGIQDIWEKDEKRIVWGLHEFGKPPTLISPRPIIRELYLYIDDKYITSISDDLINRWLANKTNEEIYNELFR